MAASGIQVCGPVLARKWQTEYGLASAKPYAAQIVLLPGSKMPWVDDVIRKGKPITRRKEGIWKHLKTKDNWADFMKQEIFWYYYILCRQIKTYIQTVFSNRKVITKKFSG